MNKAAERAYHHHQQQQPPVIGYVRLVENRFRHTLPCSSDLPHLEVSLANFLELKKALPFLKSAAYPMGLCAYKI